MSSSRLNNKDIFMHSSFFAAVSRRNFGLYVMRVHRVCVIIEERLSDLHVPVGNLFCFPDAVDFQAGRAKTVCVMTEHQGHF